MVVILVIDLFVGYDQISLDAHLRNMAAFQSPLGLVWLMTLTQGWTRAIPVSCRTADIVTTDTMRVNSHLSQVEDCEFGGQRF